MGLTVPSNPCKAMTPMASRHLVQILLLIVSCSTARTAESNPGQEGLTPDSGPGVKSQERSSQSLDAQEARFAPPTWHALGLMTTMRLTEAWLWPEPFARVSGSFWLSNYRAAFTEWPKFDPDAPAFRWDGDSAPLNLVGHGLFGSEVYLRARSCHLGWLGALAFTTAASTAWEYGFEANGVRPSAQDLVYTPLAGLVLGEGRFQLVKGLHHRRGGLADVLRWVVDPFGELERAAGSPC